MNVSFLLWIERTNFQYLANTVKSTTEDTADAIFEDETTRLQLWSAEKSKK